MQVSHLASDFFLHALADASLREACFPAQLIQFSPPRSGGEMADTYV